MGSFDSAYKAAQSQIESPTPDDNGISLLSSAELPESYTLEDLYVNLVSDGKSGENDEDLRNALILASCLEQTERLSRRDNDEEWRCKLEVWLANETLPDGKIFTLDESLGKYAADFASTEPEDDKSPEREAKAKRYRYKYTNLLSALSHILSLRSYATTPPSNLTLLSLICYTSPLAHWMSSKSYSICTTLLSLHQEYLHSPEFIINYLLRTFIKPIFSKAPRPATITPAARKAAPSSAPPRHFDFRENEPENQPWRSSVPHAIIVLEWIVENIDPPLLRSTAFPLLIPPILTLLDSPSNSIRRNTLTLLPSLFPKLSGTLLTQTGLASVFQDALLPICLSLPSLTPLEDSVRLIPLAYGALWALGSVLFEDRVLSLENASSNSNSKETEHQKPKQKDRTKFYTLILHQSVLPSFLSTIDSPKLLLILLPALSTLVRQLAIYTVKYLKDIIPLVTGILLNPLWIASVPEVVMRALQTLRETMLVGWGRIGRREWRLRVLEGLVGVWGGVEREDKEEMKFGGEREKRRALDDIRYEIEKTAEVFMAAVRASDDKEIRDEFEEELSEVLKADNTLRRIFLAVE
ncbi:hypothetical protein ACMFMF_009702 [Clarireedia jacksonii]